MRILALLCDIYFLEIFCHRQPGFGGIGTEARVRFFIPQHRRSALIAIEDFNALINQELRNPVMLNRYSIFSLFQRNSYSGYPNLVPEIGERNASACELKQRQQFRLFNTSSQTVMMRVRS